MHTILINISQLLCELYHFSTFAVQMILNFNAQCTKLIDLSVIYRNKLTESEAMAMAITRHAALKSRMQTPSAPESATSVLEMAKLDVARQRQKAQVVLRNPALSKVKCVKPVKPRGSSFHSTMNGAKPSSIPVSSSRPQSKCFPPKNVGRLKVVTPRLPWNLGNVQSKTDSGLVIGNKVPQRTSLVIFKEPSPKLRKPSNYLTPADRDKPLNNLTSKIPICVNGNLVLRRSKPKSANPEAVAVKRRSQSLESLLGAQSDSDSYLSPTQCFKCRKDMSRVLDSSTSDRFSDAYSSASDLNCSLPELQFDVNNNNLSSKTVSGFRTEVLKAEKLVHRPPPVDIVSDTEYYQHHLESDSQADSDYGTSVVSDSEVYRHRNKLKDKKNNLHLDSPKPHLLREQRSESAGSIRERKIQIEQDLDSLLDSMAFALESYDTNAKSEPDVIGGSTEDALYTPPVFFRPIFEVKI